MAQAADKNAFKKAGSIYEFTADDIDGNPVSLEKYKGYVCIIVNVASKWGFTDKNYKQLQALYGELEEKGLRILAFPCNQFGSQEPGTNAEIKEFATGKYGVTFDMFAKIDVNKDSAHPLWKYLKHKQGGTLIDAIKWNFTKFLVDRQGQPVKRYAPNTEPNSMRADIDKYLALEWFNSHLLITSWIAEVIVIVKCLEHMYLELAFTNTAGC